MMSTISTRGFQAYQASEFGSTVEVLNRVQLCGDVSVYPFSGRRALSTALEQRKHWLLFAKPNSCERGGSGGLATRERSIMQRRTQPGSFAPFRYPQSKSTPRNIPATNDLGSIYDDLALCWNQWRSLAHLATRQFSCLLALFS